MNATTAPRNLAPAAADLDADNLATVAALKGVAVWQAGIERCRAAVDRASVARGAGTVAAGVWRRMSPELRAMLLMSCTDVRDPMTAAAGAWGDFSEDERNTIGATAREFRRQLERAGWLR